VTRQGWLNSTACGLPAWRDERPKDGPFVVVPVRRRQGRTSKDQRSSTELVLPALPNQAANPR